MTADESFKKPGSVPFDWEIRPGVPKTLHHRNNQSPPLVSPPPQDLKNATRHPRLKPPPSGFLFFPTEKRQIGSVRSASKTHSRRWSLELPLVAQRTAVTVVSSGCFPARRKESRKRRGQSSKREPKYVSDTDTHSFWSVSSRKSSIPPFQGSPSSTYSFRSFQSSPRDSVSSCLSCKQSPRNISDADWAAFGLF